MRYGSFAGVGGNGGGVSLEEPPQPETTSSSANAQDGRTSMGRASYHGLCAATGLRPWLRVSKQRMKLAR